MGEKIDAGLTVLKNLSGMGEGAYIDGFWQRDSHMMSRCAFGCGGSGDLVKLGH